jgi:hypothetical protein
MRRYASDSVKYLNQASIERLLNDDNCYSQSSGEYDEQALKDRLIELKSSKAEVLASKGYDQMLEQQMIEQTASSEPMQFMAAIPRYVKPIDVVKVTPTKWKFLIKY